MKKNSKKKIFLLMLFISFSGISTIFISNSLINSSTMRTHDTSMINFKELLQSSQVLAWDVNGSIVCNHSLDQEDHDICSDGSGGAIITWSDERQGFDYFDIYAQHIDSDGIIQWEVNGTAICTEDLKQLHPKICSDGSGGAIIAWTDAREGFSDYNIYTQRIDSNGIIQWDANGTLICNENKNQYNVQICSDGAGGAIITWEDPRNSPNVDIYAQRIDSSGTVLWTSNGVAICSDSQNQYNPRICSDGSGGAIIAWEDYRNGPYDIYAQRIDSNGNVQWVGNGIEICTADDSQYSIEICSNNAGGSFIAWIDERNVNKDIYGQYIDSNGIAQWTDNGTAICSAADWQLDVQICSIGIEGAIFTWKDLRNSAHFDIYSQHISLNGTIQWTVNGKAICTADNGQNNPQICSDGADGAIITWQDYRSGSKNDIYAQRINSNGDIKWMVNGLPVCVTDGPRYSPLITTEGVGTVIIVWEDLRDGNYDLYAQKLENPPPTSNHPPNIITSIGGSETINWTLSDDFGTGSYRVLANNTIGNYYIWVDWTSWANNTALNVPINTTTSGNFEYTIQYYDDQHNSGISDTVIVQIPESEGGISGYSLFILLSCSFGLILIITKKLKQMSTT